jgi:hypothetical protein
VTLAPVSALLTSGLPQTIVLDGDVSLTLTLPTGVALQWRDAEPLALVSSSDVELEPYTPDPGEPVGAVRRAPLRLLVLAGGRPVAAVPLVAGLHRTVPDQGGPDGVRIELEVARWEIRAGTLRSPGDFGSFVELAWGRADRGGDAFEPPPLNPMFLRRSAEPARLQSDVGAPA